jgi:hypothetical protein
MQPAKVSTPPPGVLGADSLGLALVDVTVDPAAPLPPPPGNVAVTPTPGAVVVSPPGVLVVVVVPPGVVTVVPPLPRKVEVVGGDSGAMGATCGAGVPMADGGSPPGVVVVLGGGAVSDWPSAPPEVPGLVNDDRGDVAETPPEEPPRPWAAGYWGSAAANIPTVAVARAVARIPDMVHLPLPAVPQR